MLTESRIVGHSANPSCAASGAGNRCDQQPTAQDYSTRARNGAGDLLLQALDSLVAASAIDDNLNSNVGIVLERKG